MWRALLLPWPIYSGELLSLCVLVTPVLLHTGKLLNFTARTKRLTTIKAKGLALEGPTFVFVHLCHRQRSETFIHPSTTIVAKEKTIPPLDCNSSPSSATRSKMPSNAVSNISVRSVEEEASHPCDVAGLF